MIYCSVTEFYVEPFSCVEYCRATCTGSCPVFCVVELHVVVLCFML